jgi:hypothetical protein
MDYAAVVSSLVGGEAIFCLEYDRRKAPLRHCESRGESDDSASDYNGTIGICSHFPTLARVVIGCEHWPRNMFD